MVESEECYVDEAYEALKSPQSIKRDYVSAFEKLAMQYGETVVLARYNLISLDLKKFVRIIALLDLLRMKLLEKEVENPKMSKFQLVITAPTIIKKRPLQSAALQQEEKLSAIPNTTYLLNSCKNDREHWQIRFTDTWKEIWYVYKKHCVINEFSKDYPISEIRPAFVKLEIPYKSQLDNEENPLGSCNTTSLAMVIEALDPTAGDLRHKQLEDHIYRLMQNNGLSRHSPTDLARVINKYYHPVKDDFTVFGSFERCRNHLAQGYPCIFHGYFTSFGHILVAVGYDTEGFLVHDPYGEWFSSGYDTSASGAYLHYSYDLISQTCMPDDQFWVHYISR